MASMNIQREMQRAERRLRRARATMQETLRLAGLEESTYYRWKAGQRRPRPRTWERFVRAVDKLAPPKAKTGNR